MKETQMSALILAAANAVLLAVFIWLPVTHGERAFFGVRVEPDVYRGEGQRRLRRYRRTLAVVFASLAVGGYFSTIALASPAPGIFATLMMTIAGFAVYAYHARYFRPLAAQGTATRFASPLSARTLADYTHWWLEAVVVLLILGAFAALAYFYPRFPEQIPVHWNFAGAPDRWERKSLGAVFFLPALGLYLQVFFLVLKNDLAGARMTLPAVHAAEFLCAKERYLLTNIRTIDVARLGIAALFHVISWLLIVTAVDGLDRFSPWLNAAVLVVAALMVSGIFYFIRQMSRVNEKLKAEVGESYVMRPGEEKCWRHGGLTYHNPEDPALVVEKLVGYGYTINTAHPAVISRIILFAGVPLFVLWALLAL